MQILSKNNLLFSKKSMNPKRNLQVLHKCGTPIVVATAQGSDIIFLHCPKCSVSFDLPATIRINNKDFKRHIP